MVQSALIILPPAVPSGGGGLENIQIDGWASGDRTPNVTASVVNITVIGVLDNILNESRSLVYTNGRTLDGTEYWQYLFGSTVRLHGIVMASSLVNDQGLWNIHTLKDGVYTPQAANIQMGLGINGGGGTWLNTWLIDAANQAGCDGVRIYGVSGALTNVPWKDTIRFHVSTAA